MVFVAILVVCESLAVMIRFLAIAGSELFPIEMNSMRMFHCGDGTTCIGDDLTVLRNEAIGFGSTRRKNCKSPY